MDTLEIDWDNASELKDNDYVKNGNSWIPSALKDIIAIEIVNNSTLPRDVKLLSAFHYKIFDMTGLFVRTVYDNKLSDDQEMTEFIKNINISPPMIAGIELDTSLVYGNWGNKVVNFVQLQGVEIVAKPYKIREQAEMNLAQDPESFNPNTHIITTDKFILSRSCSIEITDIRPTERLLIMFYPANVKEPKEIMRKRLDDVFNYDRKKKLSLLNKLYKNKNKK